MRHTWLIAAIFGAQSVLPKLCRWWNCLLLLPIVLPLAAVAADLSLGMNYTWWRINSPALADCKGHPGRVFDGSGIIDQYDDPGVSHAVQGQLREMRHAGFSVLRVMVSHRRPFKSYNQGVLISPDGSLADTDRVKLQSFVRDVAAAGFRTIEITTGGFFESSLFCRQRDWGDCFDPARTDENWRFTAAVTAAAREVAEPLRVRIDLENEGCPAASMPAATLRNARRYLQVMATRFHQQFDNEWVVSCPDSPHADRLRLLLADLRGTGLTPRLVEVHTYRTEKPYLDDLLDNVARMANALGASITIGEMRYQSGAQAAGIGDWLGRNRERIRSLDLIQWPLREPSSNCPIDTPPPYAPGPLEALVSHH